MTDDELVEALAPLVWAADWKGSDALTIAATLVPTVRALAPQLVDPHPLVPVVVPPPTPTPWAPPPMLTDEWWHQLRGLVEQEGAGHP